MRVLALTRYDSIGPSSRVRFYQYIPYLESRGVELQIAPLLGGDYIHRLYSGKHQSVTSLLMSYINRVTRLTISHSFDLLWIEKELLPWLPAWIESQLVGRGIPCVIDYDDAVFHRYDMHANPLIRIFLGKKIGTIMRQATTVVVGNDYLAEHARQVGASRIKYLPSVVDINRYPIREKIGNRIRIGWIGTPSTAPYLALIRDALEDVSRQIDMRLVLVGPEDRDPLPGMAKEVLPWSSATEVVQIQSFDVGIMPLWDGPFERGKCGYKLIQYMACGLPVIASAVGVNSRIIEHGKTGFLASTSAEWVQALVKLSQSASLRNDLGKAGRTKVEQEYCLQVTAPRLFNIIKEAVSVFQRK
jgi:glycosyltransferase involved in cell wall biosynthesis